MSEKLVVGLVVGAYLAGLATPVAFGWLAIRSMERPLTRARQRAIDMHDYESRGTSEARNHQRGA